MQIEIEREHSEPSTDHPLFGTLLINGSAFCLTQEPPIRADGLFIPGECALLPGSYNLSIPYCPKHRQELPLLAQMPYAAERRSGAIWLGMRIHHGIRAHEAYGEIVVGYRRINQTLLETHQAFSALFGAVSHAVREGEAIDVEIRGTG